MSARGFGRQFQAVVEAVLVGSDFDALLDRVVPVDQFNVDIPALPHRCQCHRIHQVSFEPDVFSCAVIGFVELEVELFGDSFFIHRDESLEGLFAESGRRRLTYRRSGNCRNGVRRKFGRERIRYRYGCRKNQPEYTMG